jgi:putative nucleotidyltransferase with HDIG domain
MCAKATAPYCSGRISAKVIRRSVREPIDIYVGAVTVAGAIVIGSSAFALPTTPFPREWAILGVLALIASRFPLRVPGQNAWFSISDTFYITSALLFGPAPATVTIAVDSMLMSHSFKTFSLRRFLFNSGAPAVAFWAGAEVYYELSGAQPLFGVSGPFDGLVFPVGCFALIYFVLNSWLTAIAISLEKRTSTVSVWRSRFAVLAFSYFASGSAAYLLILLGEYLSVVALIAVVPLIAVINLALRSWTGRIEDAEQHLAALDKLYLSTIGALSTAIEAKDGVTSGHIHRVQHYAMGLARAVGDLDEQTLKAIEAAALLHDTGKLAVPERILNKPGKLTPAEFETMKLHVDAGADILSSIDFPYPVVPIVRAHHENWDGTGYPNGLKGVEIPIGARILSVVDCYDALTSDRPYRPAMTDDQALAIIRARRGTMYYPVVVDTFERVCRDIDPFAVKPQMQKAIKQINLAAAATQQLEVSPTTPTQLAANNVSEGPEALRGLFNLARILSGRPSATDVASMIWAHVRHIVPQASCAFFFHDPARDVLSVRFAAGEASDALQGLEIKLGERLTGWVGENQQHIINSDAHLDLGPEAAFAGLRFCMSLPLTKDGQLAAVFSLYSKDAFTTEQSQILQNVLTHLATMFLSLERRPDSGTGIATARQTLRVVVNRS